MSVKQWFNSWFASETRLDFTGYIAVIIGCCNPIGRAIAFQCVQNEGINVVIVDTDRHRKSLYSLQNALKSQSKFEKLKIEAFCIRNLNEKQEIDGLVSSIKSALNTDSIHLLFNNVDPVMSGGGDHGDIPNILCSDSSRNGESNQRLQSMMDLSVWSIIGLSRSFLPLLTSRENVEGHRKCFIVNTSSLKAACSPSDSMYGVTGCCSLSLSEAMRSELEQLRKEKGFDLRVKALCPGLVEENDGYNLVNMTHKHEEWQSAESTKQILKEMEISSQQFGDAVFDGIRNDEIFIIQSQPKIFRIFAADKLISMMEPWRTKRHSFAKRLFKSMRAKL